MSNVNVIPSVPVYGPTFYLLISTYGAYKATYIQNFVEKTSVADPGCLSQISDLDFFYPRSRIMIFPSRIHIRNTELKKELKYFLNPKKCY